MGCCFSAWEGNGSAAGEEMAAWLGGGNGDVAGGEETVAQQFPCFSLNGVSEYARSLGMTTDC